MATSTTKAVCINCDTLMRLDIYLHDQAELCREKIELDKEMILNLCDTPNDIAFASAATSYKNGKKELDKVLALITQIEGTGFLNLE